MPGPPAEIKDRVERIYALLLAEYGRPHREGRPTRWASW